jgi:hypothetical protein
MTQKMLEGLERKKDFLLLFQNQLLKNKFQNVNLLIINKLAFIRELHIRIVDGKNRKKVLLI